MTDHNEVPLLPQTPEIISARTQWRYTGRKRPDFALPTGPHEESVWDYPRPPVVVDVPQKLRVMVDNLIIAETQRGKRVLETAGAPTYYFPPEDVDLNQLTFGALTSICEWKGLAQTFSVDNIKDAGWRYVQMFPAFAELYQWPSFYPGKLACYINDERVEPQPGGYYGGWVTENIVGPVKGEPGSQGW
jgi:uncharacterized protein (DUF427 family)